MSSFVVVRAAASTNTSFARHLDHHSAFFLHLLCCVPSTLCLHRCSSSSRLKLLSPLLRNDVSASRAVEAVRQRQQKDRPLLDVVSSHHLCANITYYIITRASLSQPVLVYTLHQSPAAHLQSFSLLLSAFALLFSVSTSQHQPAQTPQRLNSTQPTAHNNQQEQPTNQQFALKSLYKRRQQH